MTSKSPVSPREAYVWVWPPNATRPVVAGRIEKHSDLYTFTYGRSYLDHAAAIPLFTPELPLQRGVQTPLTGLSMAGCLRDAAPDAWGRRVIMDRLLGSAGASEDLSILDELTYLLEAGSDRIGALDIQRSPSEYIPLQIETVSLEMLQSAVADIERGVPLAPALHKALLRGASIGGARPKVSIDEADHKYIAKFEARNDTYSVVKGEFIAMRLAALVGLNVAAVQLTRANNRDVLLIERFDRHRVGDGWARRPMVSALTLFGLDEMMAHYASYTELASIIRQRFTAPKETLRELFSRITFNILTGNTDDHARNHAAFWDGSMLTLTPAYDICPQNRTEGEATQAMAIDGNRRFSQLSLCLDASHHFLLGREQARQIIDAQIDIVHSQWAAVCDLAALELRDRRLFWQRQFLNPYALEGY